MPQASPARSGAEPTPIPVPAWPRRALAAGAVLGLLTVAGGALAAHLPEAMLPPPRRIMLDHAVQMQGWHAAALLVCGLLGERPTTRRSDATLRFAAGCFVLGILLFAGGVDALAFGGDRGWASIAGRLAPTGGTLLMLGWLLLAVAAIGRRPRAW